MKTITKIKLVLSICALTLIFSACKKDSTIPNLGGVDCNGIENGLAVIDSCYVCHQSYIYNFQIHTANYIDDTTGLVLDLSTQMLILAGSSDDIASNPNWNDCK